MVRSFSRLMMVFALISMGVGVSTWIVAQDGGTGLKRPLDLPNGGRGSDEEEEDAPETISFYGGEYEGDGFFFCLDKSCSMGWGSAMTVLKAEMSETLNGLTENSEFSVVAFSDGWISWSPIPQEGNSGNRGSAIGWVQALNPAGGTCMAPAGVETIRINNLSDKESKRILVLGDGVPNCPGPAETVSTMTGANWQRTPIDTIYIAADSGGVAFMQQLAAANGGDFSQPGQ